MSKKPKVHTKAEFTDLMSKKLDVTKADANKAIDAFLESVTEIVKNGESVSFTGFGKFSVGERAARQGRNPQTGKVIDIKACKMAKFTAGKFLKDAVNS